LLGGTPHQSLFTTSVLRNFVASVIVWMEFEETRSVLSARPRREGEIANGLSRAGVGLHFLPFGGKTAFGYLPWSLWLWSNFRQSKVMEESVLRHLSPRIQRMHALLGCEPATGTEPGELPCNCLLALSTKGR